MYLEREVNNMRINVEMRCPFCGEEHAVEVNLTQFEKWQNGELIQNAMPELSPMEREQLISNLCPKCQIKMFNSMEEEDEDFEPNYNEDEGFDPYMGEYTWDC